MEWYRVRLRVESWMASAWQSDTIWGHLCWALVHDYGEDNLLDFIGEYENGSPPLLVSNGFPGELLPRPVRLAAPSEERVPLATQRQQFRQRKEAKGVGLLTTDEFVGTLAGETISPAFKEGIQSTTVTLKNQINRLTSTTSGEAGAGLYSFEQYWWESVSIYLKVRDDFVATARELFEHLAQTGYGKRKSVGYGQVALVSFESFDGFPIPADANGFVSLSNFVPAVEDPFTGYWDIMVKYGKLGEEFAFSESPFKKPLIMLTAGSCFYDTPYKEYYGRLVRGLSPIYEDKIVQYAFALPVPMKLPGDKAEPEGGHT